MNDECQKYQKVDLTGKIYDEQQVFPSPRKVDISNSRNMPFLSQGRVHPSEDGSKNISRNIRYNYNLVQGNPFFTKSLDDIPDTSF